MLNASDLNALIQIRSSIERAINIIEEVGVEVNNDFLRGFMLADVLRSANEIGQFFQIYFQKEAKEVNFPAFPNIVASSQDTDFEVAINYLKDFQTAIKKMAVVVAEIEIDPIEDEDLLKAMKDLTS